MNTRADGNTLCLKETKLNKNTIMKEAPLLQCNYTYRGYSHYLLGSITVEASLSLPVFFIIVMTLFYIFQIIFDINYMQLQMSEAVRNYAVYNTKLSSVASFVADEKLILWNEDKKICYTEYRPKILFFNSELFSVRLYQQMRISDYSGKRMVEDNVSDNMDIYVYIADNGRVYHKDSQCTYLNPSIISSFANQIDTKRNSSGAKYKSCERCCRNGELNQSDIVFITSYGNKYHIDKNCSGLKRSIRRVKLSDIGGMSACSKCGVN